MSNSEQSNKVVQGSLSFDDMIGESSEEASQEANTSIQVFANQVVLSAEDITIPRLRLAQGLTKEVQDGVAKPGEWLLSGAVPRQEIMANVIAIAKFRRLNKEDDGTVLCRSEDGNTGIGDPGGVCEDCPMSKWTNSTNGGRNAPPPCSFGYRYLLDIEGYGQAVYEMKKTALSAAKALNGMVVRAGYGNTRIVLRSQKGTGARGTFYIPSIIPVS